MNLRTAAVLTLLAAPLAACKNAPINGNADPRSLEGPGAVVALGPAGQPVEGRLGPAAREAVKHLPLGSAGGGPQPGLAKEDASRDEIPFRDRWRVGFPAWERGSRSDSPYDVGAWWDPYGQNVLKGDYPILGSQNTFLNVEAQSITSVEWRKSPTPSGPFTRSPGNEEFFGNFHQRSQAETMFLTLDLFHGETSFKPVDWRVLVKAAANRNYAHVQENTGLFANPDRGESRDDEHTALQQWFAETTLASVSDKYDVIQLRVGTQQFNSDFRGFIFFDEAFGVRLFGNWDDNLWQWNLAYFKRWNKDTNSGLNEFKSIEQDVFLANVYRQDVLAALVPHWSGATWSHGLTTQLSFHWFEDDPSVKYDSNGFLVRPRPVGTVRPNETRARWLGWANDGHVGRINVNSALYRVWGEQEFNEIAGRGVDIGAWMAALELSIDKDWMRFRVQGFWQSGDHEPQNGQADGFDAIFDNPNFAGGEFGFWNRNAVRLTGSGVGLVQPGSLLNSLRSSKIEGSPGFVSPGLLLVGGGWDAQVTPHLKLISNASYLWFDDTSSMEYVLGQDDLHKEIGWDLSAGVVWRPLLTDNVIVKSGVSALVPGEGFKDIYTADTLFTVFGELILTW